MSNMYEYQIQSILKDESELSQQQLLNYNQLLNDSLKNLNMELDVLLQKKQEKLKSKQNSRIVENPDQILTQDNKNNTKILNNQEHELKKLKSRVDQLSQANFQQNLQDDIEQIKIQQNEIKQEIKQLNLKTKKKGNNLSQKEYMKELQKKIDQDKIEFNQITQKNKQSKQRIDEIDTLVNNLNNKDIIKQPQDISEEIKFLKKCDEQQDKNNIYQRYIKSIQLEEKKIEKAKHSDYNQQKRENKELQEKIEYIQVNTIKYEKLYQESEQQIKQLLDKIKFTQEQKIKIDFTLKNPSKYQNINESQNIDKSQNNIEEN